MEFGCLPKLYTAHADWWQLLSPPADYEEEASFIRETILSAMGGKPATMLEFGSGGGNNASFLKEHFELTLTDLSPAMLRISRGLNPECEHIEGDMRTLKLDRQFDVVFIHDAIDFIVSLSDLELTIRNAFEHCVPGGIALFMPDYTTETFVAGTQHGGEDDGDRGLRYLEWDWDPDPDDHSYVSLMACVLRDSDGTIRCFEDHNEFGLFSMDEWLRTIDDAGFNSSSVPHEHGEIGSGVSHTFLGIKQE